MRQKAKKPKPKPQPSPSKRGYATLTVTTLIKAQLHEIAAYQGISMIRVLAEWLANATAMLEALRREEASSLLTKLETRKGKKTCK